MDYKKVYDNICIRGKEKRELGQYCEKHHIIPRCMGGKDVKDNLTTLTYREHFIAHLLLTKIYKEHRGINYAFLCMLRKQPTGERILTARMVDTIKRNYKKFKELYCTIPNPGTTENSRNAARKRMLERNPISLDPSKNRTAQPIRIHFENGEIKEYSYAKGYCIESNLPYATMKYMLKKDVGSKKYKIKKIERVSK
jgi:5-methylcytosine-specific restriction endonuclease McrA